MHTFRYKAKNSAGQTVTGLVEAADTKQAVGVLREQNLVVTKIGATDALGAGELLDGLSSRVGGSAMTNFTRQLATMIAAGLTLVEALGILESQTKGYLAKVIGSVKRNVEGGQSFSMSLASFPKVFDTVYISLIRAGEKAGVLDTVLLRLAETYEKQREFRGKVTGALIYPAIVLVAMVGAAIIVVVYVIPQLGDLYSSFGDAQLPLQTRMLLAISEFTRQYWYIALGMLAAGVFGVKMAMKNADMKRRWERLRLSLPVIGSLYEQIQMTEIARTMSLLVASGVPIVEALDLISTATKSLLYQEGIISAKRLVEKGSTLSQAFAQQEVFPNIMAQMLSVGEETGKVDEIMGRVATFYESESEQRVKGLTSAIEPLIMIILAVGVAFLVFAIIMPIYELTSSL